MVFSSHLFVFYFLPLAAVLYALTLHPAAPRSARHLVLVLLSYFFYGWANPAFVLIMLFSTAVDYACGLALDAAPTSDARRRKIFVAISVCANLGLLAFFKYFNFGVDSYNALIRAAGAEALAFETALRVTLPLGISFYTFQSMSYTIDVYRGRCAALRNPIDFACYVSMFPQLVAGPIVRFHEIAEQLQERVHSWEKVSRGLLFFSLGMAKKVLLANPCGRLADLVFDAGSVGMLEAWWGTLAYAFQIYFDFSGYSDMAIGLGLMFGFVFPRNFDAPYRARSITEFWRRWHMSLSRWLRDYLYIPLGGNRKGPCRTLINIALVMLLGGLWHGASWTFVAWGAFHGGVLIFERLAGVRADQDADAPATGLFSRLRVVRTFLLVLVGWVFFRAASLPLAFAHLGAMIGLSTPDASAPPSGAELLPALLYRPLDVAAMAIAAVVVWAAPQTWDWAQRVTPTRALLASVALAASLVAMETQGYNPFIYFIF